MSLHLAAQHLMNKGRGPDDTLVHMSKGELQSLQKLAESRGGSLTINPETGLPEAGFLSSLLPTVIGGALVASGVGAPLAAMMVGGGTALATGSLGKGMMAGLGAYGGAGLTEGLMGAGTASLGTDAVTEAAKSASGLTGDAYNQAMQDSVTQKMNAATPLTKLSAGVSQFGANPLDTMTALGGGSTMKGAAMIGAATLPSMLGSAPAPVTKTYPVANELAYNANPQQVASNAGVPGYGHQGQNFGAEQTYFNPSYIDTGRKFKPTGLAGGGQIELHGSFDAGGGQGGGFGGGNYTPMGGGFGGQNPGFGGNNTAQTPQAPTGGLSDLFNQGMGNMSANGGRGGYGGIGNYFGNIATTFGGQNGQAEDDIPLEQHGNFKNNMLAGMMGMGGQNPIASQNSGLYGYGPGGAPKQTYEQYVADNNANLARKQAQGPVGTDDYYGPTMSREQFEASQNQPFNPSKYAANGGLMYADGGETKFAYDAPKQMVSQTFQQWLAEHPQQSQGTSSSTEKDYGIARSPQITSVAQGGDGSSSTIDGQNNTIDFPITGSSVDGYTTNSSIDDYLTNNQQPQENNFVGNQSDSTTQPAQETNFYQLPAQTSVEQPQTNGASEENSYQKTSENYQPSVESSSENPYQSFQVASQESPAANPYEATNFAQTSTPFNSGYQAGPDFSGSISPTGDTNTPSTNLTSEPANNINPISAESTYQATGGGGTNNMLEASANDYGGGYGNYEDSMFAANGGLMAAHYAMGGSTLGGYSDGGRLLRGPGDGVSDSIPAVIGNKQPARLADGEFVVPARIVSELGNGSTEAGARKLYAMMDRIQKARSKTVGKGKVATNSRADKHLPA